MAQEKPRKRDRLRAIFSFERPQSPGGRTASLHSRATSWTASLHSWATGWTASPHSRAPSGSPTTPDLPSTSVLGGAVGPNVTTTSTRAPAPSTQQFTPPTEPTVETQPSDTTRDAILKSNPISQPVSTSAEKGGAHNQIGKEGEPIPTATIHAEDPSLWSRAFKGGELSSPERELSTQERKTLADIGISQTDIRQIAPALGAMTEGIVNRKKGKDWKFQFMGEEIVMRDIGMKILLWIHRFKQIGDTIVQYDPGHAALPWAGFRFLLEVGLRLQLKPNN